MDFRKLQKERLRRLAQKDFSTFFRLTWDDPQKLVFEKFHKSVCDALMKVLKGEIDRLMILAPPRSGKTKMLIHHFPVFFLGNHPNKNVISAAYSKEFSTDAGYRVKTLVEKQNIYPKLKISAGLSSMERFVTTEGGWFFAVGRSSALRGRGGDLILVDDAVKSEEEANSPRILKKIHDWYDTDVASRINSASTPIIVTNTRSSPDDLCGHLLNAASKGGDQWHVIEYPAIENEGHSDEQSFSPKRHPLAALKRIRRDLKAKHLDKVWHMQYQQRSYVKEGSILHVDWLKIVDDIPLNIPFYKYVFADFGTAAKTKHKTEFCVAGVDSEGKVWVLDWETIEGGPDLWVPQLVSLFERHKPFSFYGEAGIIRRMVEPYLVAEMRNRKVHCRLNWIASSRDKASRATAFCGMAANGMVNFFRGSYLDGDAGLGIQWNEFPDANNAHDSDKIDALSILGQVYPNLMKPPSIKLTDALRPRQDLDYVVTERRSWMSNL